MIDLLFYPIGIAEYRLSEALPENLKSTLPSIEEIEDRLEQKTGNDDTAQSDHQNDTDV